MSRRTFIKQWNPAVPIGGRGRGRKVKKGGDPDQAYLGGIRTLHDPSADARRQNGGRDADGSTHFYSASGLNAAGLPAPEDRFRAQTRPISNRGGRGKVQQRVGMFRNAIQSNVIFGGISERVQRTSRKKIERILAPESDVPESVHEWRRSPSKNTQRRHDVYEYESEDEDEEEEAPRYQPRRRVSNPRRAPDQRRDPDYDPYEFRDEDSAEDNFPYPQQARPRRTTSRITAGPGGPSSSRAPPPAFARERLRTKDERTHPRRLFGESTDEERERADYDRRPMRRADERERQEPRMERRTSKRAREMSPPRPPVPAARQQVSRRHSRRDPPPPVPATPAGAPQSSVHWLRENAGTDDGPPPPPKEPQYPKGYDANYTPAIAMGIARRILSGLPRLTLKDNDGESYLTASRSIIAGALERFDEPQEGVDGDPLSAATGADADAGGDNNHGAKVLRELMNRTQLINVSEESEDEDDEDGSEAQARGRFENIFSRHAREDSPVLERLFNQTMREASNPFGGGEVIEEEEVDTAQMLGLADASEQQPGSGDPDPFEIVPRTAGEDSGASTGSNSSALSSAHYARRSMADSHRSLALMGPPTQQRFVAGGSSSNRSSDDYSSERSRGNTSRMGGGGGNEKSFPFQMGGIPSHTTHSFAAPPSTYDFRSHNNNDGSFNFEF